MNGFHSWTVIFVSDVGCMCTVLVCCMATVHAYMITMSDSLVLNTNFSIYSGTASILAAATAAAAGATAAAVTAAAGAASAAVEATLIECCYFNYRIVAKADGST